MTEIYPFNKIFLSTTFNSASRLALTLPSIPTVRYMILCVFLYVFYVVCICVVHMFVCACMSHCVSVDPGYALVTPLPIAITYKPH